jgi:hypothetical protein
MANKFERKKVDSMGRWDVIVRSLSQTHSRTPFHFPLLWLSLWSLSQHSQAPVQPRLRLMDGQLTTAAKRTRGRGVGRKRNRGWGNHKKRRHALHYDGPSTLQLADDETSQGRFAAGPLQSGTTIAYYNGKLLSYLVADSPGWPALVARMKNGPSHALVIDGFVIDGASAPRGSHGHLFNSARGPDGVINQQAENCRIVREHSLNNGLGSRVSVVTTRDVPTGEELLWSYPKRFWSDLEKARGLAGVIKQLQDCPPVNQRTERARNRAELS